MENQIIRKCTEDLRRFNPTVDIFSIKSEIGNYFWSFEIADESANGSGAATNPELAFMKAVSEFVERTAVRKYSKQLCALNSSGFAAHVNLSSAENASIAELIERDAFLVCWFAQILPAWIPLANLNLDIPTQNIVAEILKNQISIKVGILATSGEFTVAAGMLDFGNWEDRSVSLAFASEADDSLNTAIQKVILSLARIANLVLTRKVSGTELFQTIDAKDIKSPFQHLEFYLNREHRKNINHWWNSQSTNVLSLSTPEICTRPLDLELASSLGRHVTYSECPELLKYFCGNKADLSSIEKRLDGLNLKIKSDPDTIHPLS